MIFSSLGSIFGAVENSERVRHFSQRLEPWLEKDDTYPWLVDKVVCLNSRCREWDKSVVCLGKSLMSEGNEVLRSSNPSLGQFRSSRAPVV